jgi:predicted tellurium resistance membrane protein TerC
MAFILVGLLILYVLRHLLLQVIVTLIGVLGLIVGVVLLIVGLALIFGKPWLRGRVVRLSLASHQLVRVDPAVPSV